MQQKSVKKYPVVQKIVLFHVFCRLFRLITVFLGLSLIISSRFPITLMTLSDTNKTLPDNSLLLSSPFLSGPGVLYPFFDILKKQC